MGSRPNGTTLAIIPNWMETTWIGPIRLTEDPAGLPYNWIGQLDWTTGLDNWIGQLDWTTGLDNWIGQLDWTMELDNWIGQLDWTTGLDNWIGQLDWTIGLDNWIKLKNPQRKSI
jgi:hypothetical protein